MKDKNWLNKELDKSITGFNGRELSRYEMGRLDGYTHASMLLDELDEPEKTVLPKFVADWIESYRKKTLVELINDAVYSSDEDSKCFRRWFHGEMGFESNYSEFLSRAWLDGYEVDKEKKWVVKQRKLYLKSFDIWREECNNAEFVFDKESTIKFTDKVKAEAVALLVDGTVEEVTE